MNHCLIIASIIISAYTFPTTPPAATSRVIIYNNHKITQTVTTKSNGLNTAPSKNRYPGHTKNESTTHRVAIAPVAAPAQPTGDCSQAQEAIIIDNTHTISQDATHATINTHSIDPLMPNEVLPANHLAKSSWLAALIPPIIANSRPAHYFLSSLGLGYVAILAKLVHTSYVTLAKLTTWSSWQPGIAIETMQLHEKQYAQELFTALQTRYINAPINAHFLSPLVHFINDVDAELSKLAAFISLHNTIDKFNLTFMFPKQKEALNLAHEKIKRLEYFKSIIINWVGEYKA